MKIVILRRLVAMTAGRNFCSIPTSCSRYLRIGEVFEGVAKPNPRGLYTLQLRGSHGNMVASQCSKDTFVVYEKDLQPVFHTIQLRYRLCGIDSADQEVCLDAGSVVEVMAMAPNDPGHTKEYVLLCRKEERLVRFSEIQRWYFKVITGTEDTISIWDEE